MELPTPDDSFFKSYEQKIFRFIWDAKPDKIKRTYLYNEYELGGLRLLNIKALNLSLKASLIQKLYLYPKWFPSRLLRKSHPLFKNGLNAMSHFQLIENYTFFCPTVNKLSTNNFNRKLVKIDNILQPWR